LPSLCMGVLSMAGDFRDVDDEVNRAAAYGRIAMDVPDDSTARSA
jgi:hypothetical protein